MLTIERPSLMNTKLIAGIAVFVIGFAGSLSVLHMLQPADGQLSSGRQSQAASQGSESPSAETSENGVTHQSSDHRDDSMPAANGARPESAAVPVSSYVPQQSGINFSQPPAQPDSRPAVQTGSSDPHPVPAPSYETAPQLPSTPAPATNTQPEAQPPSAPAPLLNAEPVSGAVGELLPSLPLQVPRLCLC